MKIADSMGMIVEQRRVPEEELETLTNRWMELEEKREG